MGLARSRSRRFCLLARPDGAAASLAASGSARRPLPVGQCPLEVLIEQGDGEGSVAMGWAIDHSFANQLGPAWSNRLNLDTQATCDVAGPMWAGTEVSHCAKILFFFWRKPIEPHQEEVSVKLSDDLAAGCLDISNGNRRA